MLRTEILSIILDCKEMKDLKKINNVCCLFRKCFLDRGGWFALDRVTSERYFSYLLSHDRLDIFTECLKRGFLEIDQGNLLDKNKHEVAVCAHEFWVNMHKPASQNKLALFVMASDVKIITCRPCMSDRYVMEENTETMVGIIRSLLKSREGGEAKSPDAECSPSNHS
ncbi:Hypothetical protein BRZCDTV_400 [Brazilian cedratvirus IHUMI]|uniref:F-box domain-containing protein n=1 Tax=Brazilian cedratvirus IHUMI TaxID=2126980 RepID=A0A2R8FEV2_9VIRU|nr:Hypothetical protein BRZCDTV_400 [Brazilian cedratvirus IHUMI]